MAKAATRNAVNPGNEKVAAEIAQEAHVPKEILIRSKPKRHRELLQLQEKDIVPLEKDVRPEPIDLQGAQGRRLS